MSWIPEEQRTGADRRAELDPKFAGPEEAGTPRPSQGDGAPGGCCPASWQGLRRDRRRRIRRRSGSLLTSPHQQRFGMTFDEIISTTPFNRAGHRAWKMDRGRPVPLSGQARSPSCASSTTSALSGTSSRSDQGLSDVGLAVLLRMKVDATVHQFRAARRSSIS